MLTIMLTILFASSLVSIAKCQTIEYSTINCKTERGSESGSVDDAQSRVNCNALGSTYKMTSCGVWSAWNNIDGSFIENGDCVARMGSGGAPEHYVRAVAQCCELDLTATCIVRKGSKSGSHDDAESVVYCQSNEYLTGCTVITEQKNIDGAIPDWSQRKCTAINGDGGNGVEAIATCCSYSVPASPSYTIELDCYNQTSDMSGTGDGHNADIGCNNGYFISGCSGWNNQPSLDAWRIEDNLCRATNSVVGVGVYAYAICCREKKTYIPTEHPTADPTYNPTFNPTTMPSSNPTIIPTFKPTNQPSIYPTLIPIYSPTIVTKYPSSTPTYVPTTNKPTPIPIEIVVNNPTTAPKDYNKYTTNDGNNGALNDEETTNEGNSGVTITTILISIVAVLFLCTMALICRLIYVRNIKPKKTKMKQSDKLIKNEKIKQKIELQQPQKIKNETNEAHILAYDGNNDAVIEGIDGIDNIDNVDGIGNKSTQGESSRSSSSSSASLLFETQTTNKHDTLDVKTVGSNINNDNVSTETPSPRQGDV